MIKPMGLTMAFCWKNCMDVYLGRFEGVVRREMDANKENTT
jgi:hypothetical protein